MELSIEEAVSSGKSHGTTWEDLYGCLYFYISDQLHALAERLSLLNVSFKVLNQDAVELSRAIASNSLSHFGVGSETFFDRIEFSNIGDTNYVGIAPMVDAWGKYLKKTKDATLLGYFMNWTEEQPDAVPQTEDELRALQHKLSNEGKVYTSFFLLLAQFTKNFVLPLSVTTTLR